MSKANWTAKACGIFLLWAAAAVALPAQTFTSLHSFAGITDGAFPRTGLVQGTDGNLHGTTFELGPNGEGGTIFNITSRGTLTTLYGFCPLGDCAGGGGPYGLIQGTDGNYYGATSQGGAGEYCTDLQYGCGTVFKITPSGMLTTLYSFCSQANCTDGLMPLAGLVHASNGHFYGTTEQGGANNRGTVFKITPNGTFTVLYSFCSLSGCADGDEPLAPLVQGTDGDLYGTTTTGGRGGGTVFKITPGGEITTLYSFLCGARCPDGNYPAAALVQGTAGSFYGTTGYGGANGDGTVFEITPSGRLTTLHNFDYTDGDLPLGALVQGTDGNFYGTTSGAGASGNCYGGCGTIFTITSSGTLTTLYNFCSQLNCTDGNYPVAGLVQGTDGKFYGTTEDGGDPSSCNGPDGCGTVFSLSVGLGPFVKTNPTSAKVGAGVNILGTDLTGATSVTFNGTPAAFTVKSASDITTTVPAGATTGTVQVVTPGGTLSSNVPFTVRP